MNLSWNLSAVLPSVSRRAARVAGVLCALSCIGGAAEAQSAFSQYVIPLTVTVGTVGTAGTSGDGGDASAALIGLPSQLVYDAQGNLYILDKSKSVIRRVDAKTNVITTIAGTGALGFSGDGGQATAAKLNGPNGMAFDQVGNIYIADTTNNRIRKITVATGVISTICGDGGTATLGDGLKADGSQGTVELSGPNAVAVDVQGNIYIADSTHQRVRKITASTGIITTISGSGTASSMGNGGTALAATVEPRFVAEDTRNNLIVTERAANDIRVITPDALISQIAGNQTLGYTGDGGLATAAELNVPNNTVSDIIGTTYIMDSGNTAVRVVDPQTGKIYSVTFQLSGPGSTTPIGAAGPLAFAVSPNGTYELSDNTNHVVRSGMLPNFFAATAVGASSAAGSFTLTNGDAVDTISTWGLNASAAADFSFGPVSGCTLGTSFAVGTTCNSAVTFKPTAPGLRTGQLLTTDAGGAKAYLPLVAVGNSAAVAIGPGFVSTLATVTGPSAVAMDAAGNVYAAGSDNTVRKVSAGGTVTTVAGTGVAAYTGDGGAATSATLNAPGGVVVDPTGNVFIADTGNSVVRVVGAEAGVIRSITPAGYLNGPKGLATDAQGNLYIADTGNNVVREIVAKTGVITTLAGTGTAGATGDNGAATAATLKAPGAVSVDASGNVYIADTGNNTVRKIAAATGVITTVAGTAGTAGSAGDGGAATSATLNAPAQIAVDAAGDVYIACAGSNTVRMVTAATGLISTVAGTGTAGYTGDAGLANAATLKAAAGLALDQFANLYVGDTGNNAVRKVVSTTTTLAFAATDPGKTTATQTVTVTNFGNQPLTLTGMSMPAGFVQKTSGGVDCSGATTLAAGASCAIAVQFAPTGSGSFNSTTTLTDNALGKTGSTQTITLTGTGNATTPTAITVTSGNNQTTAPYTAFPTALVATVVDQNGFGSAGVSVTFTAPATGAGGTFANGTNTTTVTTVAGGTATATLLTADGTRGTFAVTAKAAGITTAASFSETIAGNPVPAMTVAYAPTTNPVTYGASITLTATLTGPVGAPAITGTVTFLDGSAVVGTGTVSGGKAVSAALVPSAGAHSYTATYAGDGNYGTSTSANAAALTVNPLAITVTANGISVPFGTTTLPAITGVALQGVLPQDVGNVSATVTSGYTGSQGVGFYPYTVALTGSAAGNYTPTTTSGVTVTPAPTTLVYSTIAPASLSIGPTTTVTFTATLTSSVTAGALASQSVTFTDNGTSLGVRTTGAAGVATLATTFALGTHVVTATFAGGGNYAGTSVSVTFTVVSPGVTLSLQYPSITVKQGQVAVEPMTFNAAGGLLTQITFSCSGQPANSTCSSTPVQFTATAATSNGTGAVYVTTAGGGTTASVRQGPSAVSYAGLAGLGLLALVLRRRKKLGGLALVMMLAVAARSLSGCSSGTPQAISTVTTPVGTSTITVIATSGSIAQTATFTLNVTASSQQ